MTELDPNLTRVELQHLCRTMSLPISGTKPVLRRRLSECMMISQEETTSSPSTPRASSMPTSSTIYTALSHSHKRHASDTSTSNKRQRLTPYRSTCSQQTKLRMERALSQRLFLIAQRQQHVDDDDEDEDDEMKTSSSPSREYDVLGLTGNVYTVTITTRLRCTCPDARGHGNICKHILFVMHRVLKVARDDPLIWQTSLLPEELTQIFQNADRHTQDEQDAQVLADTSVRREYARIHGLPLPDDTETSSGIKRRTLDGTDCGICCEELSVAEEKETVWCQHGCGHNFHASCMTVWAKTKRRQQETVTCPYCRTPWPIDVATTSAPPPPQRGIHSYVNLAHVSSSHQQDPGSYDGDLYYHGYGYGRRSSHGSSRRRRRR